jgi:hypothetical protein
MDLPFGDNVERRSLREDSWNEACAEKLYQSQRAGRDVGNDAIREWVDVHWPGFLRARCIEHLLGTRFWVELKREKFGILRETPVDNQPILDSVIDQLIRMKENLDLICWLRTKPPKEQETIRGFLRLININDDRLPCQFSDYESSGPCQSSNS